MSIPYKENVDFEEAWSAIGSISAVGLKQLSMKWA
jgi:hypothetical protein